MKGVSTDIRGVNILDPKELLACAQDHSEEGRRRLVEAVAQFFDDHALNETERSLASEIMLNLIRQAEIDLRQVLSERLSIQENVPPELIVYLANDEISVARQVLLRSPVLNDVDLIYIITSKGEAHWQTIAQREKVSPVVADRLIETGDTTTVLNLVDNQRVNLQKSSLKKLVKVALRSEELQAPLLRRPEVDTDVALDLYMIVGQALRQQMAERFNIAPVMLDGALDGIVQELAKEAKGIHEATPDMMTLAQRFLDAGSITPDMMVKTLRRGQVGFFLALFATKAGLLPEHVTRLLQKDGGRSFVVACRHIGMMKSEFASIFLLSRGIRSGDKIVDQRELAMALKNFDAIKTHDVERIMQSWVRNPELI